jgi:glycosyltransferase involved in cell wall biosynthesis
LNTSSLPAVTVVIPAFNSSSYISAALESLARQTIRAFEVLVVDDGSTDDTRDKASADLDRLGLTGRVMLRPERLPRGVASCRNHGIGEAIGEWIALLDSDDLFEPTKLETVLQLARAVGGGPCAVHHAVLHFDDGTGEPLASFRTAGEQRSESTLQELLARNSIATSTVLLHRKCFDQTRGFDTRLNGVEDYWMWLRIAKRWRWYYVPEELTRYRIRPGSLMQGRTLSYYVGQYTSLLDVAATSGELSNAELAQLQRSVLTHSLPFLAGKEYRTRGVGPVLSGLWQLSIRGHPFSACSILYQNVRASALGKVTSLRRALAH